MTDQDKIDKALVFIRQWCGTASLATNPRTRHLYEKYELLVRFEAEGMALLTEIADGF